MDTTQELASLKAKNLKDSFEDINGIKVLISRVSGMERGMFNSLFDSLKVQYDPSIVLLALVNDDKISYICGVSATAQNKFNAGAIIKKVSSLTLGSGGGRKDVAQGGGKDISKLETVLDILLSGNELPDKYKDHQLKGEMQEFRECHIEPDWLLVYRKEDKELILYATATGTHADLFNL